MITTSSAPCDADHAGDTWQALAAVYTQRAAQMAALGASGPAATYAMLARYCRSDVSPVPAEEA